MFFVLIYSCFFHFSFFLFLFLINGGPTPVYEKKGAPKKTEMKKKKMKKKRGPPNPERKKLEKGPLFFINFGGVGLNL